MKTKLRVITSKIEMRKEFLDYLEAIEKLPIKRTFLASDFPKPETKLGTLISSSVIKTLIISEDLLSVILYKEFFASLSLLRMLLEEVILITFAVSKLQKTRSLKDADHILMRIAVGQKTYFGQEEHIQPYNINTTLEEAEKYIEGNDKNLKKIFDDTYTFISEYVHPNAPSRYHFNKRFGNKIRITNVPTTDRDVKMLLNYACMILGLYIFSIKPLMNTKLTLLPKE